ncbi:Qat anti-phage system QueC-like protein QatC [Dyadobacter koreensis]|nr:Qat anti-phage system QueC-like protein QatC [Dyadobacter koreensis]
MRLRLVPSEVSMDLLVIACTMYAADTRIRREHHSEDNWTRIIELFIPVSNLGLWNSERRSLEKIFRFLTGDIWSITFRERSANSAVLAPVSKLKRFMMPYETDTVCLFSGGMDSFIGAIDLLEKNIRPLLVGHSKSADVSPYQKGCGEALNNHYKENSAQRVFAFIKVPKAGLFNSEDHTERGRSFMFLTLGAICASCLKDRSKLIVPENGMISLNIPLTPLRTGSHSTRTTHPHYFGLMQSLFDNLSLGVTIENPYQFKTKGEMLLECLNKDLVRITPTMSCSHPSGRFEGLGNLHCGSCVPCIIRQASYLSAGISDEFRYRRNIFKEEGLRISKAEGADIIAFKYMIEKAKLNPGYLTAAIRNTGPLGDQVDQYVDVYNRALLEVDKLIKEVVLI